MAPDYPVDDAIETAPPVDASYGHTHESDDEKPVLSNGGEGPTQRRLKGYHITWIGLCGGIGTGLFIGAGSAYATSGPAGLLLAYLVVGAVLWCVMQSISELATLVCLTIIDKNTNCTDSASYLPLALFLTGQLASSTLQSVSPSQSHTATATPSPSQQNVQHPQFSSVTGPTSHQQSSSPSVWFSSYGST